MNSRRRVNSTVMSLLMKIIRYSLGMIAALIVASSVCSAKPWRGLAPLVTTRAQVIEALGAPKLNASDQTETFDLTNEVVVLRWIRPTCGTQTPIPKGESFRPSEVVLQITVRPKAPLKIKMLDDTAKPTSTLDWDVHCVNHSCSFTNRHNGFGYSLADATHVSELYYFASESEQNDWNRNRKSCSPSDAT